MESYFNDIETCFQVDERYLIHIDPRSHLEVSDNNHRYGKKLRLYFQEFVKIRSYDKTSIHETFSNQRDLFELFFKWLDDPFNKPEVEQCSRHDLDSDTVLYLKSDERRIPYVVNIDKNGILYKASSAQDVPPSSSSGVDPRPTSSDQLTMGFCPLNTGPDGWIFVIRGGTLFAHIKKTKSNPRFHHSTFFSGAAVEAAGLLVATEGKLQKLFPHSGHYRPAERHLLFMLEFFYVRGMSLAELQVDAQRLHKVARALDTDGGKVKKVDSAYMLCGEDILHFLRAKREMVDAGVFNDIENLQYLSSGTGSMASSYSASYGLTKYNPSLECMLDKMTSAYSGVAGDVSAVGGIVHRSHSAPSNMEHLVSASAAQVTSSSSTSSLGYVDVSMLAEGHEESATGVNYYASEQALQSRNLDYRSQDFASYKNRALSEAYISHGDESNAEFDLDVDSSPFFDADGFGVVANSPSVVVSTTPGLHSIPVLDLNRSASPAAAASGYKPPELGGSGNSPDVDFGSRQYSHPRSYSLDISPGRTLSCQNVLRMPVVKDFGFPADSHSAFSSSVSTASSPSMSSYKSNKSQKSRAALLQGMLIGDEGNRRSSPSVEADLRRSSSFSRSPIIFNPSILAAQIEEQEQQLSHDADSSGSGTTNEKDLSVCASPPNEATEDDGMSAWNVLRLQQHQHHHHHHHLRKLHLPEPPLQSPDALSRSSIESSGSLAETQPGKQNGSYIDYCVGLLLAESPPP